jgi:acyl carrier protein
VDDASTQNVRERARAFFVGGLKLKELRDDEDVFASGFVNSLLAMQLITFVETSFGLEVDDDELELSNFCSIDALTRFVEGKLKRNAS